MAVMVVVGNKEDEEGDGLSQRTLGHFEGVAFPCDSSVQITFCHVVIINPQPGSAGNK